MLKILTMNCTLLIWKPAGYLLDAGLFELGRCSFLPSATVLHVVDRTSATLTNLVLAPFPSLDGIIVEDDHARP